MGGFRVLRLLPEFGVYGNGIIGRIKPSDAEILENPRARSAIMRVAEKRMGSFA